MPRSAGLPLPRAAEGEHGFGEDRRRAGPINRSAAQYQRRQCRGRAPASWGNGELDTTGNVRHLHAGQRFSEDHPDGDDPDYTGDLGGYAYTAFGKRLAASEVGGLPPPGFAQPFTWQGKRGLGGNLYYSRARIWSADLGAFLQPDQYAYLSRGGTLWSWPGQNPFRWADPSGRVIQGRFGEDSRFLGDAAGWLASNALNEWGQGNYGAAALDFGAALATGLASVFASPAMDLVGFGTVGGGIRAGAAAAAKECSQAAVRGAAAAERGIVAANGTKILGYTKHGIERAIGDAAERAGTKATSILDALKNPNAITSGVDKLGRPFQTFEGTSARVVVNPETGQIVSVNPIGGAGVR